MHAVRYGGFAEIKAMLEQGVSREAKYEALKIGSYGVCNMIKRYL